MKILSIVLGVLLAIGGVYCLMTPIATYSVLSWLIGLAMLVEGIGSVVTWNDRRKLGFADGWTLLGAIVSIILGCILLVSYVAQFAVDLFIAYMIAAWFVIGGITRIIAAVKLRQFRDATGSAIDGSWGLLLVLGIIIVILGVLCLFNPLAVMVGVGAMLGVAIIFSGIDLIVRGIQMP